MRGGPSTTASVLPPLGLGAMPPASGAAFAAGMLARDSPLPAAAERSGGSPSHTLPAPPHVSRDGRGRRAPADGLPRAGAAAPSPPPPGVDLGCRMRCAPRAARPPIGLGFVRCCDFASLGRGSGARAVPGIPGALFFLPLFFPPLLFGLWILIPTRCRAPPAGGRQHRAPGRPARRQKVVAHRAVPAGAHREAVPGEVRPRPRFASLSPVLARASPPSRAAERN